MNFLPARFLCVCRRKSSHKSIMATFLFCLHLHRYVHRICLYTVLIFYTFCKSNMSQLPTTATHNSLSQFSRISVGGGCENQLHCQRCICNKQVVLYNPLQQQHFAARASAILTCQSEKSFTSHILSTKITEKKSYCGCGFSV